MSSTRPESGMARRDFLKASATVATAALAAELLSAGYAIAQGNDKLKVGVIGCGGRGSGATRDCLNGSPAVEIHAVGDLFQERWEGLRGRLTQDLPDRVKLPDERCFTGFDAYQKVLDSGVDMVILAAPPGFRPMHFKAAIDAGKHVFMEKPVCVCPTGGRMMLEAGKVATEKKLGVVAGTQRRHQRSYVETVKRIHDGAIGKIVAAQCYWNQGGLWRVDRRPEWSEAEWQIRDWLYFAWLSGDHIVEQHVHNIDVCNWVIGTHPVKALGMGGRQVRTEPVYGNIFDHHCIDFEYPDGVHVMSMCRQIDRCAGRVGENVLGTEGGANPGGYIWGKAEYRHEGKGDQNPYVQEHADLVASIQAGEPLNETQQVTESTLTAVMGRMSDYTGQEVTWDQLMNSKLNLVWDNPQFGDKPIDPIPVPGQTELI
jgi:myo-inositol 2-dehydrogenase / D-chiro-inositol 1-dehydrogenase